MAKIVRLIVVIIFFMVSLAVFYSVNIPPDEKYWFLGFVSPLIPLFLGLNLVLLLSLCIKRSFLFFIPLTAFLFGFKFIGSTFNYNTPAGIVDEGFKILNYNVSGFEKGLSDGGATNALLDWLMVQDTDIYCFQEFSNNPQSDIFNTIDVLKEKYPHFTFSSVSNNNLQSEIGVAIFSRYPIIDEGEILFQGKEYNRAAFADIAIQTDTVRVISAHLESMQLKQLYSVKGNFFERAKESFFHAFFKIKSGLIERSSQADILISFIKSSPYPVIIAGDFNHTPYSYVYNEFNTVLTNAFENTGKGFGFTYAGNKLFFLRIDHQFYDPSFINNTAFETYNNLGYSDHYPIKGTYRIIER